MTLEEHLLRIAKEEYAAGMANANASGVLRRIKIELGDDLTLAKEREILDVWYGLFRDGKLCWGYDLTLSGYPYYHVPLAGEPVTVRWHIPGFVDADPPEPVVVSNWAELATHPAITHWLPNAHFSVDRSFRVRQELGASKTPRPSNRLMVSHDDSFWVVAHLGEGDFPELPTWDEDRAQLADWHPPDPVP